MSEEFISEFRSKGNFTIVAASAAEEPLRPWIADPTAWAYFDKLLDENPKVLRVPRAIWASSTFKGFDLVSNCEAITQCVEIPEFKLTGSVGGLYAVEYIPKKSWMPIHLLPHRIHNSGLPTFKTMDEFLQLATNNFVWYYSNEEYPHEGIQDALFKVAQLAFPACYRPLDPVFDHLAKLQGIGVFSEPLQGLTTPFCYIGRPGSHFAIHQEDNNSSSLNYMLAGATKLWFMVSPMYLREFEDYIRQQASQFPYCAADPLLTANDLSIWGFCAARFFWIDPRKVPESIKIVLVVQTPGTLVYTPPGWIHWGLILNDATSPTVAFAWNIAPSTIFPLYVESRAQISALMRRKAELKSKAEWLDAVHYEQLPPAFERFDMLLQAWRRIAAFAKNPSVADAYRIGDLLAGATILLAERYRRAVSLSLKGWKVREITNEHAAAAAKNVCNVCGNRTSFICIDSCCVFCGNPATAKELLAADPVELFRPIFAASSCFAAQRVIFPESFGDLHCAKGTWPQAVIQPEEVAAWKTALLGEEEVNSSDAEAAASHAEAVAAGAGPAPAAVAEGAGVEGAGVMELD